MTTRHLLLLTLSIVIAVIVVDTLTRPPVALALPLVTMAGEVVLTAEDMADLGELHLSGGIGEKHFTSEDWASP